MADFYPSPPDENTRDYTPYLAHGFSPIQYAKCDSLVVRLTRAFGLLLLWVLAIAIVVTIAYAGAGM